MTIEPKGRLSCSESGRKLFYGVPDEFESYERCNLFIGLRGMGPIKYPVDIFGEFYGECQYSNWFPRKLIPINWRNKKKRKHNIDVPTKSDKDKLVYLGTIMRENSGLLVDLPHKRYIWNYFNRIKK